MDKITKNDFLNNVQGIINEMKSQVDAYANEVFEKAATAQAEEAATCRLENIINKNGINLKESIRNIVNSEASSNKKLMETIEQYAGALNQGLYEERLYESFLSNISKFDYLVNVEKEIKRINETVEKNFKSIEITKILEEMTTTPSYYIVPMIEEDACRYVKNPTDINRTQFRAILCSFASDPYCNLMLNTIEHKNDVYGKTIAEKAMTINDKIKFVREDANVTTIFSPVQYIKENESVFNANGKFYVKKGNTLAQLSDEYVNQLSEKFLALCQLVNDPRVTMFEDHIVLRGSDKVAAIYENYVDINGHRENPADLRNIEQMSLKYDFDNNFFIMASCLHENFDNIAIIDFGKHIALNNDKGVNIDMFRIGNNIYVNAVNENFMNSTFYQNVNPIQCRNLINKHMGINVASLFEDLIPSQEKILVKLNETKNEYEESIQKYEDSLKRLKDAKAECTSEDNEKKIDDAIKSIETKVNDLKDEYKEWQKKADNITEVPEAEKSEDTDDIENDPNTDVEKSNEPIDAEDVDDVKPELMQPMGDNTEDNMVDDETITDDEFDSYLEGNDNPETYGEDITPEINDEDVPAEEPVENTEDIITDDNTESEENIEDDGNGFTEMPGNEENIDDVPAEETPETTTEEPDVTDEETPMADDEDNVDFGDIMNDNNGTEEPAEDYHNDNYVTPEFNVDGYKIASITFDQNVKTGELFKTGTVIVITPMIDGTGKMYNECNNYQFYIDETTHMPIVNTPGCPVALYNAMVNAIQADPCFAKADAEGASNIDATGEMPNDEIWYDADDVKNVSDELEKEDNEFFDVIEDEKNNSITISNKDNSTPEEILTNDDTPSDELPNMEEPASTEK